MAIPGSVPAATNATATQSSAHVAEVAEESDDAGAGDDEQRRAYGLP